MLYDFNFVTDRKNTNSLKYDFAVERGRPADVLPLLQCIWSMYLTASQGIVHLIA